MIQMLFSPSVSSWGQTSCSLTIMALQRSTNTLLPLISAPSLCRSRKKQVKLLSIFCCYKTYISSHATRTVKCFNQICDLVHLLIKSAVLSDKLQSEENKSLNKKPVMIEKMWTVPTILILNSIQSSEVETCWKRDYESIVKIFVFAVKPTLPKKLSRTG